jgi:hypothetical protein
MAIKTRRRFSAIVDGLSMKTVSVTSVWSRVEERTGQVRERLPGRVASLALKRRRRGRSIGVGSADNAAIVGSYGRRRILITLGFDSSECVQTERGRERYSSQDYRDCKIASHLLGFPGSVPTKIPPMPSAQAADTEGYKSGCKISEEINLHHSLANPSA